MRKTPWLVSNDGAPDASLRLFCFHYGGGSASVFRQWRHEIDTRVDLVAVQLPGRGDRYGEHLLSSMEDILPAMLPELIDWLEKPYVLFGYSLGAKLAYEVACALQSRGLRAPCELIVSAAAAPQLPRRTPPIADASDLEFRARLERYRGVPAEILRNEELMQVLIPILRADFAVSESYAPSTHDPLRCPVTALGGREDEWVTEDELRAWRETTVAPFRCELFDGGHFFLHTNRARLLARVNEALRAVAAAQRVPEFSCVRGQHNG